MEVSFCAFVWLIVLMRYICFCCRWLSMGSLTSRLRWATILGSNYLRLEPNKDSSECKFIYHLHFLKGEGGRSFTLVHLAGLATNSIFFCFLFVQNHCLPEGQINDPSSRKHYSLPFLPVTSSSLSQTLEWLFWSDTATFKGPRLTSRIAPGTIKDRSSVVLR